MSDARRHDECARSWEVEAARDDRLLHKDLESLRRHLTTCASCRMEQQRLAALGESLRSLPALPDDLVAARRRRHRLLSDVNRLVVAPAPARRRISRVGSASALLLLALAVAVGYRIIRPRAPQLTPVAVAASSASQLSGGVHVEIAALGDARWQKRQLGDELRIELEAGEIAATIGQRRPEQGVRIQLPDGWIDDLGTVLSVRVENRRTVSVRVLEGRVRLRLDGRAPVELGAGDNWAAEPVAIGSAATKVPGPTPNAVRARVAAAPAAATPSAAALATHAGGAQRQAMADSVVRLAREEDEAYLHIVALARAHQLTEARAAAKDYLLRFPNGFRREEVLGVATH